MDRKLPLTDEVRAMIVDDLNTDSSTGRRRLVGEMDPLLQSCHLTDEDREERRVMSPLSRDISLKNLWMMIQFIRKGPSTNNVFNQHHG